MNKQVKAIIKINGVQIGSMKINPSKSYDVLNSTIGPVEKLTQSQFKALGILINTSYTKTMSARGFADHMWKDSDTNMFSSRKNQGNGACAGKAAWLCAGSYLGKLKKKGLVNQVFEPNGYYITEKGKELYNQNK